MSMFSGDEDNGVNAAKSKGSSRSKKSSSNGERRRNSLVSGNGAESLASVVSAAQTASLGSKSSIGPENSKKSRRSSRSSKSISQEQSAYSATSYTESRAESQRSHNKKRRGSIRSINTEEIQGLKALQSTAGATTLRAREEEVALAGLEDPDELKEIENSPPPGGPPGKRNADMGQMISDIKGHRDALFADTFRDHRDHTELEQQVERLRDMLKVVEERLDKRKTLQTQYDSTLKATRTAYDRLMETAQNLQDALDK